MMLLTDQNTIRHKHLNNLFNRLEKFKDEKKFCDVGITVPGNEKESEMKFDAQKIILAANSLYFKSMFNTGFSLSGDNSVSLIGVTSTEFKQILKFLYTGQLYVNQSIISLILQSADFLQIDSITKILLKHIKKYQFSLEESLNYLDFIMTTFEKQLGQQFAKTILRNFTYCLRTEKFRNILLSLGYNTTRHLLYSDVNDATEAELLDFLLEWLEVNSIENQDSCNDLLNSIRLSQISPEEIKEIFGKRKETFEKLKGDWITKATNKMNGQVEDIPVNPRNGSYYYLMFLTGSSRLYYDVVQDVFVDSSKSSIIENLESIINRDDNREYFSSLDLTDGHLSGLLHYPTDEMKLPTFMRYDNQIWQEDYKCCLSIESYIKYGNCIIHIGGWDESRHLYLKGSAIYGQGPWKLFNSMKHRRGSHSLIMESGIIYAIGGRNDDESLSSVECLQINSENKEWKTLAPMPKGRYGASATCLDGLIYVFGGYSDPTEKNNKCMEPNYVYDIRTNSWSELPKIEDVTKVHTAINCYGKIFVLVSFNKSNEKFTIMQFDPMTKEWTKKADCTTYRPIKYAAKFSKYDYDQI